VAVTRPDEHYVTGPELPGTGCQQVLASTGHDTHELVEVRVRVQLGVAGTRRDPHPGRMVRPAERVRLEPQDLIHIKTVQILVALLLGPHIKRPARLRHVHSAVF
jgi:hypothetical protein